MKIDVFENFRENVKVFHKKIQKLRIEFNLRSFINIHLKTRGFSGIQTKS